MKHLWRRIWDSEPVVFVGALVSAWTAIVALDQTSAAWEIPVWVYLIAVPVGVFLTAVTRSSVTPAD